MTSNQVLSGACIRSNTYPNKKRILKEKNRLLFIFFKNLLDYELNYLFIEFGAKINYIYVVILVYKVDI